jgi:predicted nucleic acid-binding protein
MSRRTYLDSGVLIAALKGAQKQTGKPEEEAAWIRAMKVLDDPDRVFLVSDAVWLEVMPKSLYEKQQTETDFYEAIFTQARHLPWNLCTLARAANVARQYGIAAMDAIHVAQALDAQADELITHEKKTKPMFRVMNDLPVLSIWDMA